MSAKPPLSAFTGEGFPHEKFVNYATLVISVAVLVVMSIDLYQNYHQRKLNGELAQMQLDELKKKKSDGG